MSESKYSIDMCHGSIVRKMLLFVLPILCTYELQSLFHAADMVVIGQFATPQAMAAIGATNNPITLILKIFIGISTGANAVVAHYCGAKDRLKFHQSTHTAMAIGLYGGLIITVIALLCTKQILILMKTPDDILHGACMYMWICFLGIPFLSVFNFGAAVLRSVGDSRRPLYYLTIAGIANILLNLLFVVGFKMAESGVAIATTLSNALATVLIVRTLLYSTDDCHISLKYLKIHWPILREISWIGVPASFNSSFFNIANMVIQTAVNSFGSIAIAGSTAMNSIESFVSISSSAFQQAGMTFVAQNYGAKLYPRTARCCVAGTLLSAGSSLLLSALILLLGRLIIGFFCPDPEVILWGMKRMWVMIPFYCLGALMDLSCGFLRGLGYSMMPAAASFLGACVFRIIWILFAFPLLGTFESLFMCYPISWLLLSVLNYTMLYIVLKKIFREEAGLSKLAIYP